MLGKKEAGTESAVDRLKEEIRADRDRLRWDNRRERGSGSDLTLTRTHRASASAEIQERALAQMASMLGRMEERTGRSAPAEMRQQEFGDPAQALRGICHRLEDILAALGMEAERLADETSHLALVADRLEERPDEQEPAPEPEPVAPQEPQFRPGGQAVGIVLAAVPGFQGLMDVQRALSGLPAAEGASVVGYENGEASLQVVLRAPVSARQIVERLRESTGHQLLIEEARPEAMRLRLRFTGRDGERFNSNLLRAEHWLRA